MNYVSKRTMMETPEIRYCINTMVRRFPFVLHEAFSERDNSITIPRDLTEEYLVKISRRMVLAIRIRNRKNALVLIFTCIFVDIHCLYFRLWNNLLNEAFYLQDVISNKDKRDR